VTRLPPPPFVQHLHRRVYSIKCNWKVYIDNYLDGGYHIPHLHKGLAAELDLSSYATTVQPTTSIQSCEILPRVMRPPHT
jgi:choline monooxygenase